MTEVQKTSLPTKLLWVDLEMTGLNSDTDVILEIAAIVTDFDFNEIAQYQMSVKHDREMLQRLLDDNKWYDNYPDNKAHFLDQSDQGKELAVVEGELVRLLEDNFGDEPAVLAGNSIHNDRNFIKKWWPKFDIKLHYRMLDVSSWKLWMQGANGIEYQKSDTHRALDDIRESIAELRYYLEWFRNHQ